MSDDRQPDSEEMLLYGLIAAIGAIPVILILSRGGVFGSEATVGLLMLVGSVIGLGAMWRVARRRRLRH